MSSFSQTRQPLSLDQVENIFDHDFEALFGDSNTDFDLVDALNSDSLSNLPSSSIVKPQETISLQPMQGENSGGVFDNYSFDFNLSGFQFPVQVPQPQLDPSTHQSQIGQPSHSQGPDFESLFSTLLNSSSTADVSLLSLLPEPTSPLFPSTDITSTNTNGHDGASLLNSFPLISSSSSGTTLPPLSLSREGSDVWSTPLDDLLRTPSFNNGNSQFSPPISIGGLGGGWNLFPSMEVKDQATTDLDILFPSPPTMVPGPHGPAQKSGETTVESSPFPGSSHIQPASLNALLNTQFYNISPPVSTSNISPPLGTFPSTSSAQLHPFPTPPTPSINTPPGLKLRKNRKTIPLNAPTQTRNYTVPSATSKRDLPVFINKDLLRAGYAPEEIERIRAQGEDGVEMLGDEVKKIIDKKRVQNTMSARRARVRKEEKLKGLEERREALKKEILEDRKRVREARRVLDFVGASREFLDQHPEEEEEIISIQGG